MSPAHPWLYAPMLPIVRRPSCRGNSRRTGHATGRPPCRRRWWSCPSYDMVWDQVIKFDSKYRNFKEAIYDANLAWLALSPSHRTIIKWKNTTEIVFRSSSMYIYGPKAAGREKSALRVTKQPSLWETSWPNAWSQQLALLDSWQSLWCQYAQDFSPSWDHF